MSVEGGEAMSSVKSGDVVYLADGGSAIYIAQHPKGSGHVVGRMVMAVPDEDDDDSDFVETDVPIMVDAVFKTPPVALIDKSVADRQAEFDRLTLKITEAYTTLGGLTGQIANAERDRRMLLDKLKQLEALRYLDDWIEGRLGWCVLVDFSGPTVMKVEDASKNAESHGWGEPKYRLLSLLGKSGGDIGWNLNYYTDGSGSNREIHLCKTEGEAKAKAQQLFDVRVKWWRDGDADKKHLAVLWAKCPGLVVSSRPRQGGA